MSKTNNGDDFELLYEAYTGADEEEKDKNEELEDEENPVEEESHCDEDDEDEDDEDTVEEGFFDRAKSTASAMKGAASDAASNVGTAARNVGKTFTGANKSGFEKGKDVGQNYSDKKAHRIVQSHSKKLKNALSDFASDLVKMNITDADNAERFAETAYQDFLSQPELKKYTKNKIV